MLTRPTPRGFTLIELMVTVSIVALVMAMAAPNFTTWIRNSRVRATAESLQSGIKLAQIEAQRRAHTVVFFRTASKTCLGTETVSASGDYWQIRMVPNVLLSSDTGPEAIQCGSLTEAGSGVGLTSATSLLCFNADGRQTDATNVVGNVSCTAGAQSYDVKSTTTGGEDRPLRVLITLSGAVRLCDPKKQSTEPDGCPSVQAS